jgi:hypothetical protein
MLEERHVQTLERAPHDARNMLQRLVDWGSLVKTPRKLLRGIRIRGRRLWLSRRLRRLSWVMRIWANGGVCSVEFDMQYGFFAHMTHCLYILTYCERRGFVPEIRFKSDNYCDPYKGPNWLNHYFYLPRQMTAEEVARRVRYTKKIYETEDMEHLFQIGMSIEGGARTLHSYLRLKPHITQKVEDFWTALGVDGPVIGLHFRGTDKSREAPRVPWQHCLTIVEDYIRNHKTVQAVFVASDEQEFIDFAKNSIRRVPVYCNDDYYRSNDDRAIHLGLKCGGYEKGEDALVNVLLLAKCSILIRTTSTFSAWASIFNPNLKVILLNKPYPNNLWFPESEILRRPDTELIPD